MVLKNYLGDEKKGMSYGCIIIYHNGKNDNNDNNNCKIIHEHASSIQVTSPLVEHIVAQTHQLPDEFLIKSGCQAVKPKKAEKLSEIAENLNKLFHGRPNELEKGSSVWFTAVPL